MQTIDGDQLRPLLATNTSACCESIDVFAEIDSTNSYLVTSRRPPPGKIRVAIAEHQRAGRGRHGRRWHAPPGTGICMSVGYTFSLREDCPTSLTLAMGLSIVQSLERLGLGGVSLKWPNDLIACDRKVGGILTEVVAGSKPRPTAIVGLGLNLDFSASEDTGTIEEIAGTASDLRCCNSQLPATNLILAGLIDGFLADLARFDEQGFASFRDRWPDYDWLRTRKTVVDTGQGQVSGIACGVGPDGALELCAGSERMQIVSGSITAVGAPA